MIDLDAYCARIGYSGPRIPTIETLRALHALHPAAIAFENLDVLLDRGIDIGPAAVDAKLIGGGRGGYCYEHNGLFKRALTAMGFEVEGLAARVQWMSPPDMPPRPKTHMALRVIIDGTPWLADVGFGACVPTVPLRLDLAEPQPTAWETFRLIPAPGAVRVEAELGGRWEPLYTLSLHAVDDVDYELGNWYVSAHPTSHFRYTLIAARVTPEARSTLRNARLTVRRPDGTAVQQRLDAAGIERALAEDFGLAVEPEWRPILRQAATALE
jgi:N-hydroxyarylamine O-acetyltransferase